MARYTEWCEDLERELAEPFPKEWIQQKRQGGTSIDFVGWPLYVHKLNALVGPGWSMGTPILQEVGGKLVMGLPITILGVTRVNFGSEDEEHGNAGEDGKVRDFGSAETNSFAQALKRTLALFGMGLPMYDKKGHIPRSPYNTRPLNPIEREHAAMVEWIVATVEPLSEEAQMELTGARVGTKDYVRAQWKSIKSTFHVAKAVVSALEDATGSKFTPPA